MMVWSCFLLSTQYLVSQSWSSSIVTKVGIVGHRAGSIAIARVGVNSRDSSVVVGGDWSLNSSIVVGRNWGSVVGDERGQRRRWAPGGCRAQLGPGHRRRALLGSLHARRARQLSPGGCTSRLGSPGGCTPQLGSPRVRKAPRRGRGWHRLQRGPGWLHTL